MDAASRLGLAIEALRARIDEEFRITERLDTKARQAFALAAAVFAVGQTVAFGSFAAGNVVRSERVAILILAVMAALALALTAHKVADAEDLRRERDIDPSAIERWARERDDEMFAREMVVHLREVADRRAANNEKRAQVYSGHRGVLYFVRWTLILTGVELLLALVFRI
jgi:type VI protein secretion system component VasK